VVNTLPLRVSDDPGANKKVEYQVVAVLIADTGYELYAACETMRDLDELYLKLGMDHYISTF